MLRRFRSMCGIREADDHRAGVLETRFQEHLLIGRIAVQTRVAACRAARFERDRVHACTRTPGLDTRPDVLTDTAKTAQNDVLALRDLGSWLRPHARLPSRRPSPATESVRSACCY